VGAKKKNATLEQKAEG
jgi:IS1 family transposase